MHFVAYFSSEFFYSGKIIADEVVGTMANCVDYPIFFTVFYSACVGQYFLLWFYRFITGYSMSGAFLRAYRFTDVAINSRPDFRFASPGLISVLFERTSIFFVFCETFCFCAFCRLLPLRLLQYSETRFYLSAIIPAITFFANLQSKLFSLRFHQDLKVFL